MAEDNAMWVKIRLRPETASMVTQRMDTVAFSFHERFLLSRCSWSSTSIRKPSLDYIEQEEAKGFTHEEIFGMLSSDITFPRLDN
jgi:hypothetical protein